MLGCSNSKRIKFDSKKIVQTSPKLTYVVVLTANYMYYTGVLMVLGEDFNYYAYHAKTHQVLGTTNRMEIVKNKVVLSNNWFRLD